MFLIFTFNAYSYSTSQDRLVRRQIHRDIQGRRKAAVSHRWRARTGSNVESTRRDSSTERPTEAITRGITVY